MLATVHSRDYASLGCLGPDSLAALLASIPGEHPTGEFLRHEGAYDRIAEARREDDDRLEQGVWQHEFKRADWPAVAQLCAEAIELRSKDIQLAAWLTEAWCRLHGFAGLNSGLALLAALCENFWDSLYPPLEDAEYRVAPFHWINEKLAWTLQFIPLTQPIEPASRTFTWADWQAANRAQQQQLQNPQAKPASPAPTPSQIQQALRLTPSEFLAANLEQLGQAAATAAELETFLDARLADAGPSLRQLRAQLDEIQQWLGELPVSVVPSLTLPPPSTPASETAVTPSVPAPAAAPLPTASPGSREQAYRQLADIAAFLMRTEPHSPTPYLIHRAIRWGSLPLDQLLPELVRNEGALGELQQLLNLKNR